MSYAGSLARYNGSVGGTVKDAVAYMGNQIDAATYSFLQMNPDAANAIAAQTGGTANTAAVLAQAAQCPDVAQAIYNSGLITRTLKQMIADQVTFCAAANKVAAGAQAAHNAPMVNNQPAPAAPPAAQPAPAPTPYMAPSSFDWGLWLAIALGLVAGVGGVYYYKKHHKGGRRRR